MMDEMFTFKRNALLANLCKEWNTKWTACQDDKEKLMRLALMQQSAPYIADFFYRGVGLSKEYVKRQFSDYIDGHTFYDCDDVSGYTYGMYVDAQHPIEIKHDIVQFLWCDNTRATLPQLRSTKMYVSNKSELHIECNGYNNVIVMLFDESKVMFDKLDNTCRVNVYRYDERAVVEYDESATYKMNIMDKELRL